jgi:hypothetical protein
MVAEPPQRHVREGRGHDGLDFAWRVHEAVQQWTTNVDQKSSIALVVLTAVGAAAASEVFREGGGLHDTHGAELVVVVAMVALLALAILLALFAVMPSLRHRRARDESPEGLIYFGHLRHRSAEEVAAALAGLDTQEATRQLARQLATTSRIAWRKHVFLQASLAAFLLGAILFVVARLWL